MSSLKSWWPGVSSRLITQSRYSICITELATEMPRCFSISIQSLVAWREALRAFTEPAIWIAPENSSSFSVSVVLPASGWLMMAKVRRRRTWGARSDMAGGGWGAGRAQSPIIPVRGGGHRAPGPVDRACMAAAGPASGANVAPTVAEGRG